MRLGLFTDVHFASGTREGTRFCDLGLNKLDVALRHFAETSVDAIVGLGDLVDSAPTAEQEASCLRSVCNQLKKGGVPVHLVPGNHCVWTLSKQEYCDITQVTRSWGSTRLNGWELVFLDGCFRRDGVSYGRRNNDWKDAMVSNEQVSCFRELMAASDLPMLVFIHQRLDVEPPYGVQNAAEIRQILERSGRVRGVFQGHEHSGARSEIAGIPYITLRGMVEGDDVERAPFLIVETNQSGRWSVVAGDACVSPAAGR